LLLIQEYPDYCRCIYWYIWRGWYKNSPQAIPKYGNYSTSANSRIPPAVPNIFP